MMFLPVLSEIPDLFVGHIHDIMVGQLTVKLIEDIIHIGEIVYDYLISIKEARAARKTISLAVRFSSRSRPQYGHLVLRWNLGA